MKSESNARILFVLRMFTKVASLSVTGLGLVVLSGWFLNIPLLKSFLPGLPAMRFNTALSLLLLGSSLWLLNDEEASILKRRLGHGLAGLVLLLNLLTFSQYLFGWNLGVDEFFVKDLDSPPDLYPGRIAPLAILCAVLSSISLLRLGSSLSRYFSYLVTALSFLVILNNLFDFQLLLRDSQSNIVPAHTGVAFLAVSLAILAARPAPELIGIFSSELPGTRAMRFLLLGIVILTILIAWLLEQGESLGVLDPGKESILLVVLLIFAYSPLIYFIARNINQAQTKLLLSDQILERVNALVLVADAEGSISYVSPSVKTILGFEPSELLGDGWWKVSRSNSAEGEAEKGRILYSASSERMSDVPYEREIQDRWGNTHVIVWVDAHGPDSSVIGVGYDATDRKRAEEQLRQSEENFSKAFSASPTALMITRLADGKYLELNKAYTDLVGYSRIELIGHLTTEFNIFIDPDQRKEIVNQLLANRALYNYEAQIQNKSGELQTVLASLEQIQFNSEACILSTLVDITERKRAEKALMKNETRYRQAIMAANAIPYSLDYSTNQYTFIGEGIAELTGFSPAELTPSTLDTLIIESVMQGDFKGTPAREAIQIVRQGKSGLSWQCYHHIHTRSGEKRWLSDASIQVLDDEGIPKGTVGIFQDITDRIKAEQALRESEKQYRALSEVLEQRVIERTADLNRVNIELERASHAKDEFLANMSHELRTPLNSILGMSELLLEQIRGSLNEYQQKSLRLVQSSGQHLLELINDILDLSKIEAGKLQLHPETVEVLRVCEAGLAFVREQAVKKSILLEFQPGQAMHTIAADPRYLKQILVNLLTNAVKFTPAKGHVVLEVITDAEKGLIQFSVRDTGIGIAPQNLSQLFRPFVQAESSLNRQFEGTGLGLALVQRLADLHGGSVQVESEVGKGSCFTVNLPWQPDMTLPQKLAEEEAELSANRQMGITDTNSNMPVSRGRILLVEDNPANVLTIVEYLENKNFSVVVAHNGLEALAQASELNPNIILMDIQMPIMDGLEATSRLRADPRFRSVPIIALTALAMPGDRERCLQAGASEYVSKPVSLKQLVKMIDHLTGRSE